MSLPGRRSSRSLPLLYPPSRHCKDTTVVSEFQHLTSSRSFFRKWSWQGVHYIKNEKTLLNRMDKYKRNHLLFIHDFDVSFDNNMSERDLRKCKNRQKMSGGFRTKKGKEVFCSIMTITETCKRQGIDLLQAFRSIFQGKHIFAWPFSVPFYLQGWVVTTTEIDSDFAIAFQLHFG